MVWKICATLCNLKLIQFCSFFLKLIALFIYMYIYKLIQRGADVVFRMTNKTMVDREVLQHVAVSVMSWDSYEEEDLVRRYFRTVAKNI